MTVVTCIDFLSILIGSKGSHDNLENNSKSIILLALQSKPIILA